MGLRWKDIDFDQKVVHIRRNNTQITGEGAHIGTTKNGERRKEFPIVKDTTPNITNPRLYDTA